MQGQVSKSYLLNRFIVIYIERLVTNHMITEFVFDMLTEIHHESIFVYMPDIIIHYQCGI